MIHGIFHGDLHGGNLFVLPDGRTALLDFGIVGRLTRRAPAGVPADDGGGDDQRRAGRRWRRCATSARSRPTPTSTRSSATCGSTRPPIDPTTLTGEEMVKEVQRVVKALLGYGARMPKELMLYVKNMVFLDGAIARLAPDLDLLGRDRQHLDDVRDATASGSGASSASTHGRCSSTSTASRPASGSTPRSIGSPTASSRQRRELIQKRMRDHVQVALSAVGQRNVGRVRLVIARCTVDYTGRLSAHLPEATRLIMVKADGCVAIHADGGAYKPLNWMNAPNTLVDVGDRWIVTNPKGETLTITLHEVISDVASRPRRTTRGCRRTASRPTSRSCSPHRRTRSRPA